MVRLLRYLYPMMRGVRTSGTVLAALLSAACFYGRAEAALTSARNRITINEMPSISTSAAMAGGPYSLIGNSTFLGSSGVSVGRYSLMQGTVNAVRTAQLDLGTAHVYPNPCNVRSGCNGVNFTRLTINATITIYTVSGELVRRIEKTGNIDGIGWDLRNDSGARVASGLYIFFVKAENSTRTGKIVVIR